MTVIAVVLAASACIDTPPMAEPPAIEQSRIEIKELSESPAAKLDLLIVVDDSDAMAAYRDRLATLPARTATAVRAFANSWGDVHVGVTGGDGRLRRVPGSDAAYASDVRSFDFTRHTNYGDDLAATLAAMMDIGTARGGASQPLEAMRHALEGAGDFMRADASLAILLVSASDDASPFPIADYVAWTKRLGPAWNGLVQVSAIYPRGAPRLDAYIAGASFHAFSTAIEDGDLESALRPLPGLSWDGWGLPCMDARPLPLADGASSEHYDCAMSARIGGELRSIPQCEARTSAARLDEATDAPPMSACWALRTDRQSCFYGGGLVLDLDGYTMSNHPAFRFECRIR